MIKLFRQQKQLGHYHKNKEEKWIVEIIDQNDQKFITPSTGCEGGTSLSTDRIIIFNSKNLAIKYLTTNNLDYTEENEPKEKKLFFNSYSKNFI